MALSTMPWLVSVLPLKKWVRHHMHSLEVIILLRLLVEEMDWRLLKIIQIGSVHGLWKDKVCFMVAKQCKNQEKTPPIQPSSTLEAPNSPSLQMCLTKSKQNGASPFPIWTVHLTRHSVILEKVVILLLQKLSQLDFRWVIMFLRLIHSNIYTKQMRTNAILSSINVAYQAKTRTYSWLVMHS